MDAHCIALTESTKEPVMHSSRQDMPAKRRQKVIQLLNARLVDTLSTTAVLSCGYTAN